MDQRHRTTKKKNQVIITRMRTGYTRATHNDIIEKRDNIDFPFCNTKLTVEHQENQGSMEQKTKRYAQIDRVYT
jgi:hypothetical protein